MVDHLKESSSSTDFEPLTDESWPISLQDMRGGFATKLNVYRVMAHNPALLQSWRNFRDHVVLKNKLDKASLEIVILRTGFRRDSSYEWIQHVIRGREAGLDDERIKAVALPPDQASLESDRFLMRCVDALIDTNRLPGDLLQALSVKFGKEGVLDLIATVGMYSCLAYILQSFETPIEADILAALENSPLTT